MLFVCSVVNPNRIVGALLLSILTAAQPLVAQTWNWGGSVRGYQFFRAGDLPDLFDVRRDSEFASLRLTVETQFNPHFETEIHAVGDFLSPPTSASTSLAAGASSGYLPLEATLSRQDYRLAARFDRLNLSVDFDSFRIVAGRQAISWGVTYFWPALDLFSPFAPQRIDRDYKEGVDAVRLTVPLGAYSEVQVVGAALGDSITRDGAAAALARIHLGPLDVGAMGGRFHGDTVVGGFFTAGISGSALRGEVSWTQSRDPLERLLGRGRFWRASLGVDRQLHPDVGATLEVSYNGFGVGSAALYPLISQTRRVQRGEINALGTFYSGGALNWELHPLWRLSNAVLVNWQDPSLLWIPALDWSAGNNTSFLFALQTGFGGGFVDPLGVASEYGPVPTTLFLAFKFYY